jgi:hypothetical protein
MDSKICCLIKITMKNGNKENHYFYKQRWVKVMKNKSNYENTVELHFLER